MSPKDGHPLNLVIAGAGGIGEALGIIVADQCERPISMYIGDQNLATAERAATRIAPVLGRRGAVTPFLLPSEGSSRAIENACASANVLADCLPGSEAPRMARLARKFGLHYANLTEYVRETSEVIQIANGAPTAFALQCGLAPGFINVLALALFEDFCRDFDVDEADRVLMRVGALTRNAAPPFYYGFTWSPAGVATEYLEPATAIRDGQIVQIASLSEREELFLDGRCYEGALTSGGAADLPEALLGRVRHLDYKTLRYPGHYAWLDRIMVEIGDGPDRVGKLQLHMETSVPRCDDDLVVIYAAIEGRDKAGIQRARHRSLTVSPTFVAGLPLRAIQSTTAASLAEVIRILVAGDLRGPILQSQLPVQEFMAGPFVSRIYGSQSNAAAA